MIKNNESNISSTKQLKTKKPIDTCINIAKDNIFPIETQYELLKKSTIKSNKSKKSKIKNSPDLKAKNTIIKNSNSIESINDKFKRKNSKNKLKKTNSTSKIKNKSKSVKHVKKNNVRVTNRFDKYGSPIKKGGKHKLVFRDVLKDKNNLNKKLCDYVNITLFDKSNLSNNCDINGINLNKNNAMDNNNNLLKSTDDKDNSEGNILIIF